jgi:hypothetical protein
MLTQEKVAAEGVAVIIFFLCVCVTNMITKKKDHKSYHSVATTEVCLAGLVVKVVNA